MSFLRPVFLSVSLSVSLLMFSLSCATTQTLDTQPDTKPGIKPETEQAQKIMVMNFLGTGMPEVLIYLTEKSREAVSDTLAKSMEVFDPSVIPSEKASQCVNDSSCDLEIFNALGADFGISGEYRSFGSGLGSFQSLTLKLYHVQQQKILAQQEIKGNTNDDLIAGIYTGTIQLLEKGALLAGSGTVDLSHSSGSSNPSNPSNPTNPAKTSNQPTWIALPAGRVVMGCVAGDTACFADELDRYNTNVGSFQMMQTEVTIDMYKKCVDAGNCTIPTDSYDTRFCNWGYPERGNHPVNCVDWQQANAYCKSIQARLPTAAEWEYAAKSGGQEQKYPWGNQTATCNQSIFAEVIRDGSDGCYQNSTSPVCSKPAGNSVHGICDLAGNVTEWLSEAHNERTKGVRGGSWRNADTYLRASKRDGNAPTYHGAVSGFRCVK